MKLAERMAHYKVPGLSVAVINDGKIEWARGYDPRFGLVHVDYATQVRTPKASYHWLRNQLRSD